MKLLKLILINFLMALCRCVKRIKMEGKMQNPRRQAIFLIQSVEDRPEIWDLRQLPGPQHGKAAENWKGWRRSNGEARWKGAWRVGFCFQLDFLLEVLLQKSNILFPPRSNHHLPSVEWMGPKGFTVGGIFQFPIQI